MGLAGLGFVGLGFIFDSYVIFEACFYLVHDFVCDSFNFHFTCQTLSVTWLK